MRNYTQAASTTGVPKYYAQFDDDTFILVPTPNANLTFELHYLYQPASLTTTGDSGTTWVSKNAPDPSETALFEQRFQENLIRLTTLMEGRATRDENRFDRQRVMTTPPQQQ